MKVKSLFTAVLLALLALPVQAATLPPYQFTTEHGRDVTLAYPRNSMTVLHFWATWCGPCVRELPTVDAMAQRLATISSRQWRVVTVSLDNSPATVRTFFRRHNITALDAHIDPNMNAMRILKVGGLPTTLIIDDQGNELKRYVGDYDWTTFDPATLNVTAPKPLY